MQQTFKAKVTNLLQEKLEAQDASDEISNISKSEHSDKRFDFLHKTSNNTFRDSATKISKTFIDQKPQIQISLSIVKLLESIAEKSLYLIYNTELPLSAAVVE